MAETREIILASASQSRRQLLSAAGVQFRVVPADIDEEAIRTALEMDSNVIDAPDVAEVLARAKAEQVSEACPEALVIGSDQVLNLNGEIFSKPEDIDAARVTLQRLSGRSHELHSAVAIAEGGATSWTHTETVRLEMRELSTKFIAWYLAEVGPSITRSVGAYELEGLGAQLFEKVDGDYFTVLGLPLLATLAELRRRVFLPV